MTMNTNKKTPEKCAFSGSRHDASFVRPSPLGLKAGKSQRLNLQIPKPSVLYISYRLGFYFLAKLINWAVNGMNDIRSFT